MGVVKKLLVVLVVLAVLVAGLSLAASRILASDLDPLELEQQLSVRLGRPVELAGRRRRSIRALRWISTPWRLASGGRSPSGAPDRDRLRAAVADVQDAEVGRRQL